MPSSTVVYVLAERIEAAGARLERPPVDRSRGLQEFVDLAVRDFGALPKSEELTDAGISFQMLLYVLYADGLIDETPAELWDRILGTDYTKQP